MHHPSDYKVVHTREEDLEMVWGFFKASIEFQEANGFPSWANYDREAIRRDVREGHQYMVLVEGIPGVVFSVAYADAIIWRHLDHQDAIYLHRMVVNPAVKGKRLFGQVLNWAVEEVRRLGRKYVRMDTWTASPKIIQYYQSFGFKRVEDFVTPDTPDLPQHNRNLAITLLEYAV